MPKVTIQATKMSDARVDYISLVARPANRSPIKIAKAAQATDKEHDMMQHSRGFDLGSLFTRKAEKAEAPQVVGVITMKGDSFDAIKGQIEGAGFKVDDMIELEDDSVVLKQADMAEGEGTVVRLNDSVALITKGFRPYNMDMSLGDSTFKDVTAAQGFYPSVSTVLDVMRNSIYGVVEKADSPDAAATAVSKMFDEAKQYAAAMVKGLPAMAFKLETEAPVEQPFDIEAFETVFKGMSPAMKAKMKAKMKDMMDDPEDDPAKGGDGGADEDTEDKMKAKKAEGAGKEASGETKAAKGAAETAASSSVTIEDVSKLLASALSDTVKKFETALAGVTDEVKKSVGELSAKVEKAEKDAAETSLLLGKFTVGGAGSGDPIALTSARKSEGVMRGGEIDTAYLPRSQRVRRQ